MLTNLSNPLELPDSFHSSYSVVIYYSVILFYQIQRSLVTLAKICIYFTFYASSIFVFFKNLSFEIQHI